MVSSSIIKYVGVTFSKVRETFPFSTSRAVRIFRGPNSKERGHTCVLNLNSGDHSVCSESCGFCKTEINTFKSSYTIHNDERLSVINYVIDWNRMGRCVLVTCHPGLYLMILMTYDTIIRRMTSLPSPLQLPPLLRKQHFACDPDTSVTLVSSQQIIRLIE